MEIDSYIKKEEMWNFMKTNRNLFIDVNDELKCCICQNILINAHHSECSCSFCKECLYNYMENNDQCPGKDCTQYINLNENVNEDIRKNAQIKKIKLQCLTLNCNYEDCLEKMIEHVKICINTTCPFISIGCNFNEVGKINVENHISTSQLNHSKLIVDLVNNFDKKIISLEKSNVKLLEEIKSLKNDFEDNENIKELKNKLDDKVEIINTKLNEVIKENEEIKTNFVLVKEERDKKKEDNHEDNIVDVLNKISDDNLLKFQNENIELKNQIKKLKKYFDIKINEIENNFKIDNDNIKKHLNNIEKTIMRYESCDNTKDFVIHKLKKALNEKCDVNELLETKDYLKDEIAQSRKRHFYWKIENIIQKREEAKNNKDKTIIYNDPFYSKNGYKFRFHIYPNGIHNGIDTYLSVALQLIKSNNDEILKWPCKEKFTFHIMNPNSKEPFCSYTFCYENNRQEFGKCFEQPTSEINDGLGRINFISWSVLLDKKLKLIKNDSLYLRIDLFE